jgi:hypothetical protein
VNNIQMSGGLPHSEIEGSKLITSSPSLIAGYHVLHRLLLPRHPPNALIALDLIQKEPNCLFHKGMSVERTGPFVSPVPQSEPKACTFPALNFMRYRLRYESAAALQNFWLVY